MAKSPPPPAEERGGLWAFDEDVVLASPSAAAGVPSSTNSGVARVGDMCQTRLFLKALCFGVLLASAVLVIGYASSGSGGEGAAARAKRSAKKGDDGWMPTIVSMQFKATNDDSISQTLIDSIDSDEIRKTLHTVTKEPHQAGTEANLRVAENLAEIWRKNGLEDVHFNKYRVLLNYPSWDEPNHVTILDDRGATVYRTSGLSPDLSPREEGAPEADNHARIQWLAYSANGTVEGEPVYCHYGTVEDFARLRQMKISVEGKIAIMRYNQDFRGDKVRHAQQNGAIGAIIYTDPMEFARDGPDAAHFYPQAAWMPAFGVQRGSVAEGKGDPLSPLLPARSTLFPGRSTEQARELEVIPKIPVLPIGYGDAYEILRRMGGEVAPREWWGTMNCTYHLGPGFVADSDDEGGSPKTLRVEVHSNFEMREIQNVIGYFYGEDRDQWVILGNHYDAWVYGSLDPNSATAILAEVARAFSTAAREHNWRPKRTIMFCAWDAEEYALIGSTEFVQEFAEILRDRAVVYLNIDLIKNNETLAIKTVPTLYRTVTEAAKKVRDPNDAGASLYDTMLKHFPSKSSWQPDIPEMPIPDGGSDHMQFLNFLGIPVADITYRNASFSQYPLYHTMYEVPFLNEHIIDRNNLAVHRATGQYWAELARAFADSPLLPLNATTFAQKILDSYVADIKTAIRELYKDYPAEMADARQQVGNLIRATRDFLHRSIEVDEQGRAAFARDDEQMLTRINNRLRKIDQCFINPSLGMAARDPEKRHVLFSLSGDDAYKSAVMAAVHSTIEEFAKAKDTDERKTLGKQLAYELTVVQYSVQCAVNTLQDYV